MNNSQIDQNKPEVSIPDLIAELRERQAECMSLSEEEVALTPAAILLLNSSAVNLADALESVTAPADERREHYEIVVPGCDCGGCFGSIVSTDEGSVTAPTEDERERLVEFVGQQLGDAMLCTRVWEAWGVGTMTEDDFVQAGEDDGFVDEFVDALIARGFHLSCTSQPVQVEVTEASVKILAKHMANAASDWNHDDCDDDDHSLEHSNWEAYTGDALRALSAALTPIPAVPVPEVIPGTRAALDGLSIRTTERGK